MWVIVWRVILGGIVVAMMWGADDCWGDYCEPDGVEFVSDGACSGDFENDLDCTQ